jgi:beta-lactamase regulating signal transducer with metallopeptidase domain
MMLAWMAYTITVSLLLTVAAFAAEQVAMARRAPARWIWALAIAASLVLPAVVPSVTVEVPKMFSAGAPARTIALRDMASPSLTPPAWTPRAAVAGRRVDTDAALKATWAAVSVCMLTGLAACAIHLYRRKRRWTERPMAGAMVYVSEDVGPAVVGLLRPRIVVPAWLAGAPTQKQELVVAHEQSHLDARDPQLLSLALLALVAMPWNLPLWWQVRRLRLAVEVDCDARVLRKGHDLQQYGAALIDIGERHSAFIGTAAAMAESRSSLEHRIRIMVRLPQRWKRRIAPAVAALSLCMVAVAARIGPPGIEHHAVTVSPSVLQRHAGYYQLDEHRVITVSPSGEKLIASFNMDRRLKLIPESEDSYFVNGMPVEARFVRSASSDASDGVIMRMNGVDYPMAPRVGPEAVQQADEYVARRFAEQSPMIPGGEEILRHNLALAASGQVALEDLSPEFGQISQRMMPAFQEQTRKYGQVLSVRFIGVNVAGWDMYRVQFEHGALTWHLWFTAGKVSDAFVLSEAAMKMHPVTGSVTYQPNASPKG